MSTPGRRLACLLCFVCVLGLPARSDELKLRDGTKITGTIVGYEGDHFKVETGYGFALVRRDKVASITMTDPKKAPVENKKPAAAAAPERAASLPAPPSSSTSSTSSTSSVSSPPAPPPPRIREEVEGTTYTNHAYGFRLYKPPSWQVIEGAHTLPNAVMAMGTTDETTLLVVGREPVSAAGGLESQAAVTERRLREIYENYRPVGDERLTVAGLPAMSRRFRGTVEGRDWSGRVVWVARGNEVFTFFGMTYAESDLIQIQENIITKTIASLEFIR